MRDGQQVAESSSRHERCRGLECIIGRWHFGVPVDAVRQVVDLELGLPPPLAHRWVGGIGIHEGHALVSIALLAPPRSPRRRTKAVWLGVPDASTEFALEVARVTRFVDADVQQQRVTIGGTRLPAYVSAAIAPPSQSLGWIHIEAMLHELQATR